MSAVLLALQLVCGTAKAEWVSVGSSDNGKVSSSIDVSGIRVEGAIRRTPVRRSFAPHTQRGAGDNAGKWAHEIVGINAYNCSDLTYRTESLVWHYEVGTDFATPTYLFPGPWLPIEPNSLVQAEAQSICTWKPK
jgi:hypothetical protein